MGPPRQRASPIIYDPFGVASMGGPGLAPGSSGPGGDVGMAMDHMLEHHHRRLEPRLIHLRRDLRCGALVTRWRRRAITSGNAITDCQHREAGAELFFRGPEGGAVSQAKPRRFQAVCSRRLLTCEPAPREAIRRSTGPPSLNVTTSPGSCGRCRAQGDQKHRETMLVPAPGKFASHNAGARVEVDRWARRTGAGWGVNQRPPQMATAAAGHP